MTYFSAAALVEWFKLNLTFWESFTMWQWLSWDGAKMLTWLGWGFASASAFAALAESLQTVGTRNLSGIISGCKMPWGPGSDLKLQDSMRRVG